MAPFTIWDLVSEKARLSKQIAGSPRPRDSRPYKMEKMRNKIGNICSMLVGLKNDTYSYGVMDPNLYDELSLDSVGAALAELLSGIADQRSSDLQYTCGPTAQAEVKHEEKEDSHNLSEDPASLTEPSSHVETREPAREPHAGLSPVEATLSTKALHCNQLAEEHKVVPVDENDSNASALYTAKQKVDSIAGDLRSLSKEIPECMRKTLYADLNLKDVALALDQVYTSITEQRQPLRKLAQKDSIPIPNPKIWTVNTKEVLISMLQHISDVLEEDSTTLLALDLEGEDLSRDGDITMLSLYISGTEKIYLVDICTLKASAFDTPIPSSYYTLRYVLESSAITKLLWDCRSDNDALTHIFSIKMAGVVDVQLLEYATRKDKFNSVKALDMTVTTRGKLSEDDKKLWRDAKSWGEQAMQVGPEEVERRMRIGLDPSSWRARKYYFPWELKPSTAYKFAAQRPMHPLIRRYCAADVVMLPLLARRFKTHDLMSDEWAKRVEDETVARLELSADAGYKRELHGNQPPEGWIEVKKPKTLR